MNRLEAADSTLMTVFGGIALSVFACFISLISAAIFYRGFDFSITNAFAISGVLTLIPCVIIIALFFANKRKGISYDRWQKITCASFVVGMTGVFALLSSLLTYTFQSYDIPNPYPWIAGGTCFFALHTLAAWGTNGYTPVFSPRKNNADA